MSTPRSRSPHPRATRLAASWSPPADTGPSATIALTYAGQVYQRAVGPEDWTTQREAALLLGVSVMAVNKWVRTKHLESARHDGVSVIRLREVARFAHERGLAPGFERPSGWLGRLVSQLTVPLIGMVGESPAETVTLQEPTRPTPRAAHAKSRRGSSRQAGRRKRRKRRRV